MQNMIVSAESMQVSERPGRYETSALVGRGERAEEGAEREGRRVEEPHSRVGGGRFPEGSALRTVELHDVVGVAAPSDTPRGDFGVSHQLGPNKSELRRNPQ